MIFSSFRGFFLLGAIFSLLSHAEKLKVVVTLPEFAEIFTRVGAELVEVEALLSGKEDPHYVEALPSFVTKVARADIVCGMGLEMESAWLPKVIQKSSNAKLSKGSGSFCEFGDVVAVLEKPHSAVDRSMGHVHASGNPHFNLSPLSLAQASALAAKILSERLPEQQEAIQARLLVFQEEMKELHLKIQKKLLPLKKVRFIEFHKEFSYFFQDYDLLSVGSIEEKPGVPPSAAQLLRVSQRAKKEGVTLALASLLTSKAHLRKFQEFSAVPSLFLPVSVDLNEAAYSSISKLQNFLADSLLKASEQANTK